MIYAEYEKAVVQSQLQQTATQPDIGGAKF